VGEGRDGEGIFHEARLTVLRSKYYNITSFMLYYRSPSRYCCSHRYCAIAQLFPSL
jgi:hypothetical protein